MNPGLDDLNHFSDVIFFVVFLEMHLAGGYCNNNVFYLAYHFFVILFPKFLRRKAGHYLLQEKANLHQT